MVKMFFKLKIAELRDLSEEEGLDHDGLNKTLLKALLKQREQTGKEAENAVDGVERGSDVEDVKDGDSDIDISSADGTVNNGSADLKETDTEASLALRLQLELENMTAMRAEKE